jgi:hypothetical protein
MIGALVGSVVASALLGPVELPLFKAQPLTGEMSFTTGIEGPACDAQGNIYAVSLKKAQDIAKVSPTGQVELFVTL